LKVAAKSPCGDMIMYNPYRVVIIVVDVIEKPIAVVAIAEGVMICRICLSTFLIGMKIVTPIE
jgi:hypothetical protein